MDNKQRLFIKPQGLKYTTMAMWIDENFYQEDCDYDTAYTYMYLIAEMLAYKQNYFKHRDDYEEYSAILAQSTFNRMKDETKSPIKSVLNYMKSIMYFRKAAYDQQRCQELIKPEYDTDWDSQLYYDNLRRSLEDQNRDRVIDAMHCIIKEVPKIIRQSIPKVYRCDKLLYNNLYKTCLLSLLNRFTLPDQFSSRLDDRIANSPSFDEVSYYRRHMEDDLIYWHIDKQYESVIIVTLNKVIRKITVKIRDLMSSDITDDELSFIATSTITAGGSNETVN